MHLSTSALLSGIALAATASAYDSVSFTTWNCTECTPVPGTFCSVNTRSQLPPDLCITMWNGSTTIKTYDATIPSCQGNEGGRISSAEGRANVLCSQSLPRAQLRRNAGGAQGQRRGLRKQDSIEQLQDHMLICLVLLI